MPPPSARDRDGRSSARYFYDATSTDRKRAEEELRRSEAFLAEGQRLSSTGSFSWRVGHGRDHVVGGALSHLRVRAGHAGDARADRVRASIRKTCPCWTTWSSGRERGGSDFEYEHRLLMPDGSVKYLHVVAHGDPRPGRPAGVHRRGSGRDAAPARRGGARQGPIGARACRQGHEPRRADGVDRARGQPAAGGHHHQRQHLPAHAGRRSAERRRRARDGAAHDPRRQPRRGRDHAAARAVQQEGPPRPNRST